LKTGRPNEQEFINKLAAKAEAVIADYCLASARYRSGEIYDGIIGRQVLSCKYGENARQKPASLCAIDSGDPLAIDQFELVAGDAPSYNNICDLDRLLQTITHIAAAFDISFGRVPKIAIAVKHGNACGAATGEYRLQVIQDMIIGDTQAILGGIVMTNFMIDEEIAEEILTYNLGEGEERRKLDGIIAPFFSQNAIGMLRRKKDKCRFLANPHLGSLSRNNLDCARRFRYVRGGFLRQPNYTFVLDLNDPQIEKSGELTEGQKKRLLLAWAIGATSNSNTITLVGSRMLIGNGVAQQIRVGAAKLAITRAADADHDTVDAIAYSDSFFPQPDGPEVLVSAGVDVIFASSGSINDGKVKDFCKEAGIVLWLIPDAVGRGFYGH
jgi:phosphoribosylaminoimidazolecarboxamide formyltransferase/IMP cyclohydrolase